ncbi:NUDIX domain-containing protein [Asaia bogorensis]|uniref:NUDIX hydrolase n=1 Tax=Asaia bogorensis TaxID=91915 RepID=UPI000EFC8F1F|nr:NUDIX domain-containing protein [Asaia bogorensis]
MTSDSLAPFLDHIKSCQTAILPGGRRPVLAGDRRFGLADPKVAEALTALGYASEDRGHEIFRVPDGAALQPLGVELADRGLYRPHHELFDVFNEGGEVIGQIDRGALPLLGCTAAGVHLNGLVEKADGLYLWMGHRAQNKRLDPGKLDHLAAGGICTGLTPLEALIKEAGEEAAIPPELASRAHPVATLRYAMARPEGLRQDTLFCYDLILPEDFIPQPVDGEVAFFELMSIDTVFRLVRDTNDIKFNVNLVLIDLFIRRGLFSETDSAFLRRALDQR